MRMYRGSLPHGQAPQHTGSESRLAPRPRPLFCVLFLARGVFVEGGGVNPSPELAQIRSWMYAYMQILLNKDDRFYPSNYRHITLLSCFSKATESTLDKNVLKHLTTFDLLSDHKYGFCKWHSTGLFFAFLTDSFSRFGETFAVSLVSF